MDCPARATTPHDCKRTWYCDHGHLFTRHQPDGQMTLASDSCHECGTECAEANQRLQGSKLLSELGQALMRREED